MVFSSVTFLFFFLPLALAGYFLLMRLGGSRHGPANAFLWLVSLLFYAWGEPLLVWVILLSSGIDYLAGLGLEAEFQRHNPDRDPTLPRTGRQRFLLIASLTANLGLLAVFKYMGFASDAWNSLMGSLGLTGAQLGSAWNLALPVGISFYTFQSMSYTIDVYRGQARGTRNMVDFGAFVTMFPQLVAGPIVRYVDVAAELKNRAPGWTDVRCGLERFAIGLGKKVLIADTVAVAADRIFGADPSTLGMGTAWLGLLCYAIQILFDFSGYSDMAIGLGRIMGFTFPENFLHPYRSRSITEFWRRWHVSLSTWFRDYLYIPLGGNRGSPLRTALNLYLVFILCGLWHGANYTFLLWGLLHGTFLSAERLFRRKDRPSENAFGLPTGLARAYTLLAVLAGWTLFRADGLGHAGRFFAQLLGQGPAVPTAGPPPWTPSVLLALAIGLLLSVPNWSGLRVPPLPSWAGSNLKRAGLILLLTMALLRVLSGAYSPFIYFRF